MGGAPASIYGPVSGRGRWEGGVSRRGGVLLRVLTAPRRTTASPPPPHHPRRIRDGVGGGRSGGMLFFVRLPRATPRAVGAGAATRSTGSWGHAAARGRGLIAGEALALPR